MATQKVGCKVINKSAVKMAAKPGAKADPGSGFVLVNLGNGSYNVLGSTATNEHVPIDTVATLADVSQDTSIVTVDPPSGMNFQAHGVKTGKTNVTLTATWNDGSIGPLSTDVAFESKPGPVTGLFVAEAVPTP